MTDEEERAAILRFVQLGRAHVDAERWGCTLAEIPRLHHFLQRVARRPEAFLSELDAGLEARRQALGDRAAWLAVLERSPDLLSPLRATHRETLHTGFLAWLLSPARLPQLGVAPLRAFLTLCNTNRGDAPPIDPDWATLKASALAEHVCLDDGRIDVLVDLPQAVLAIEAKVEHSLTDGQLGRYRTEATALAAKGGRGSWVVFLAKDPLCELPKGEGAVCVSYRDLARALLPVAAQGDSGEHWMLGAWLRTLLGPLLGVSGVGDFSTWNQARRGATLGLLEGA